MDCKARLLPGAHYADLVLLPGSVRSKIGLEWETKDPIL